MQATPVCLSRFVIIMFKSCIVLLSIVSAIIAEEQMVYKKFRITKSEMNQLRAECGQQTKKYNTAADFKTYNGDKAEKNEFPWMVLISECFFKPDCCNAS